MRIKIKLKKRVKLEMLDMGMMLPKDVWIKDPQVLHNKTDRVKNVVVKVLAEFHNYFVNNADNNYLFSIEYKNNYNPISKKIDEMFVRLLEKSKIDYNIELAWAAIMLLTKTIKSGEEMFFSVNSFSCRVNDTYQYCLKGEYNDAQRRGLRIVQKN